MILPPGGFAVLGFILAGKRVLELRQQARAVAGAAPQSA
jgi:electron transport complex protein RnfE